MCSHMSNQKTVRPDVKEGPVALGSLAPANGECSQDKIHMLDPEPALDLPNYQSGHIRRVRKSEVLKFN